MLRNKAQNTRLYALLSKLGIDQEGKEDLVHQFTKGRTKHSSDMLIEECQSLINHLQARKNGHAGERPQAKKDADEMRKKILSRCHEMNWKKDGKLDWERINAWMLKYGYLHKPLNDYKDKELPKLLTQFDYLLKTYYANR